VSDRQPHRFPHFSSPDEERTHMKQRMAAAFRLFDRFGFNEGVAGHLTGRDPEHPELFWVNPFGMSFGLIRARARWSRATGRSTRPRSPSTARSTPPAPT
jgi:hypothetical protein